MKLGTLLAAAALAAAAVAPCHLPAQAPRFEITYPEGVRAAPLTGRVVLMVAKAGEPEPRFLLSPHGAAMFAVDVEGLDPGGVAVVDDRALGYPTSLDSLAPGEYHAQAVANVYERVRRADGHEIWVPFNDGRRSFFSVREGNLYSDVLPFRVGPDPAGGGGEGGATVRLSLSQVIPPAVTPEDTEWVERVRIRSERLSAFWGRDVYIHANVLLPRGYHDDTDARYPMVFTFGHTIPFGFTTDPARGRDGEIDAVTGVESGYDFYRSWIEDGFPRMIAVALEQQTPYFPDSYSVNSANNGPYGDALIEEVIPALEARYRMIGEPYARLVEGASTGGWQTLAVQLQHPDHFGGAWILQPDPIDFRAYQLVDIYEDDNAFTAPIGPFKSLERPFRRTVEGQPVWSLRDLSRFEAVLGSRGRSGYQLGAWEAVYGPTDDAGYPRPLWDPMTGEIDREVADYMRDQGYDLRAFAAENWATLGPKLRGKLHFFTGDMDDFYLNLAVYRFEEFLRETDPDYPAEFTYGRPTKGHSWHEYTWAELVRRMADHVRRSAPAGADTSSWSH